MLGALCEGNPVDEAKNVFHDMLSERVEHDAFTFRYSFTVLQCKWFAMLSGFLIE